MDIWLDFELDRLRRNELARTVGPSHLWLWLRARQGLWPFCSFTVSSLGKEQLLVELRVGSDSAVIRLDSLWFSSLAEGPYEWKVECRITEGWRRLVYGGGVGR